MTIDNIRRILSSFFSWLEDEDFIVKSPVRRIHKVKTAKVVKDTYTDEALRQIEDKQLFDFMLHSDTSLSLFFTLSRCTVKPAAFSFREESSLRIEGFFSCVSFFAENSLKAAVSTSASRPLKNTR